MTATPQPISQIDTPFFEKKTGLITLAGVLALHGVVAVALLNMTAPKPQPPKVTPPLEITFITATPPVEAKPQQNKQETPPKPQPIETSQPKTAPQVENKIDPKPTEPPLEKPSKKSVKPVVQDPITPPDTLPEAKHDIPPPPEQEVVNNAQLEDDISQLQAYHDKIESSKTEANKTEPNKTEPSKTEANKTEANKTEPSKTVPNKQIANNKPVTFASSEVRWRNQANFNCNGSDANGEMVNVLIRYHINAQGKITQTSLVKSSGDPKIDREFQRQAMGGSFYPVIRDGVAVTGTAKLPINIECQ